MIFIFTKKKIIVILMKVELLIYEILVRWIEEGRLFVCTVFTIRNSELLLSVKFY